MINKLLPLLQNRKYFSIKSQGRSMLPLLQPGDLAYYKKTSFEKCRVNDLIMVRRGKITFTHRVIYKTGNYLITKGDNNLTSDGKIYPRQIIGKVYQIKRDNKLYNPENLYLIQSSLYFAEIVKIKRALEKEKIEFVFLKGLPLHLYFEGSHPRRIYADCDVLIKYQDYIKVKNILDRHHYQLANTAYTDIHKILKDKPTEVMFVKKINGFHVIFDAHFEANFLMNQLGKLDALYPQKLIDRFTEECFKNNQQLSINNYQFLILSSSNLIIYLALHFFHHNFRGAYRLEFLDRIIRKSLLIPSPPGNPYLPATPGVFLSLIDKIKTYRLQNFVYPVFLLLTKYYQTPLPASLSNSIKQWNNETMKQYLNINIFNGEPRIKAGVTRFKNLFFLSPNSWWRKLLIIFNPQVIYSVLWVIWRKILTFNRK